MNINLKKIVALTFICLVLAACGESNPVAEKELPKKSKNFTGGQYGPECNWLNEHHKFTTPGGCTKKQWADWHAAQPN